MTRKDFEALAKILREHRENLELESCNRGLAFGILMSDIRTYCKSRNPSFDGDRFTRAVYHNPED